MARIKRGGDGLTRIRTWQFADGGNSVPYIVTSPSPENHGKMVPGRLCGLMAYNDVNAREDINSVARERGQFLRIYTISFKGGVFPYPNSADVLRERTFVTLNNTMPIYFRNLVADILGLEAKPEMYKDIGKMPGLINRLWEDKRFQHITAIGWESPFSFGGKLHEALHFIALRDPDTIVDISCVHQPGLNKNNVATIF